MYKLAVVKKFIIYIFIISDVILSGMNTFSNELKPVQGAKEKVLDIELKFSVPVPFVSGMVLGIETLATLEFKHRFALDIRFVHVATDVWLDMVNKNMINIQAGIFGLQKDRRSGSKGWYSQKGVFAGYAFEAGEGSFAEEYFNYEQHHYLTVALAYKATHWWKRHIGFVFQMNLSFGVSFYSFETAYWLDDPLEYIKIVKDEPDFGDKFMGGIQFYTGVAF
jgi:hypothetical protein